jgi:type IV secretory pathway TrbF-like protein
MRDAYVIRGAYGASWIVCATDSTGKLREPAQFGWDYRDRADAYAARLNRFASKIASASTAKTLVGNQFSEDYYRARAESTAATESNVC